MYWVEFRVTNHSKVKLEGQDQLVNYTGIETHYVAVDVDDRTAVEEAVQSYVQRNQELGNGDVLFISLISTPQVTIDATGQKLQEA